MKIICIYNNKNIDGWMSAAIVKHWFIENHSNKTLCEYKKLINFDEYPMNDWLVFLGWNYGDPIPNSSRYDKVIMCDISFPEIDMLHLNIYFGSNFIYIDHNESAIEQLSEEFITEGIRDVKRSSCELTWDYFMPNFTHGDEVKEILELIGIYHLGKYKKDDRYQEALHYYYGIKNIITEYKKAYALLSEAIKHNSDIEFIRDNGEKIYQHLYTEIEQIRKRAFPIVLNEIKQATSIETGYKQSVLFRRFLCVNHELFNPDDFDIDYQKENYDGFACFWYENRTWYFSLYSNNKEINCLTIAKPYNGNGCKNNAEFKCDNETMLHVLTSLK
jgi:hypothetical protein